MLRKSFFLLTGLLLVSGLCLPSVATAKQMIAAIIVSDLPRFNQSYDAMVQVLRSGGFD
jgi:hypothetical protein